MLAPLSGAQFRMGREARAEFGEDIAPETADRKTMGLSLLLQARQEDHPSHFTPPPWAHRYAREDLLPYRLPDMDNETENFWYIELGGEGDAIRDAEDVRDELLRVAYGVWDYVKNAPENREKVFERFFQVDATNRRRSGGTGQGLVIARAICRAHGGDIRVEASRRPEGGSRFIVTLPAFALESVAASPL